MAEGLSLLFKLKASNEASPAIKGVQSDVGKLAQSFRGEFAQASQVGTLALGRVTQSLTQVGSALPVVGSSVSALSSQIGGLASPAGIASVAMLALGGVVVSLGVKLFQTVKQASELGSEIFDLTQQTGLSAERVTALKFALDQSGGSLTQFASGLKIFATEIAKANKGSEEATEKLKRLGVEPKEGLFDLDAALNKALQTIAKAPAGVAQVTLASDAFGRKIGADLIPTIVSFNGNLNELTERAKRLGVTLTDVQVEALDQFGDSFDTIKLQATLAAAQFSSQVAPEFTRAMQSITLSFGDNKGVAEQWGIALADTMRGVRQVAESELGQIALIVARIGFEVSGLPGLIRGARQLGAADRPGEDFFGPGGAARGGRKTLPGTPEFRAEEERRARLEQFQAELAAQRGAGRVKSKAKVDTALAEALKDAALAEKETRQAIQADIDENKRALEEGVRDIEEFTERAIKLSEDSKNATIDRTNAEALALQTALDKKLITQKEFDRKFREQNVEVFDAIQKHNNEVFNLEREQARKISQAEQTDRDERLRIAEAADARQISRIERRVDQGVLLESEGLRQIAKIQDEQFARRREALIEELNAYSTTLERRKAINAELILLDGQRAGSAEAAADRVVAALQKEFEASNRGFADATRKRRTTDPDPGTPTSAVEQLFLAINKNLTGSTQSAALAGLQAITTAFGGLAQAVGQVVESFVLYGSAGTSVRKVTAEILASVARQASIKAIFELAEGFAALALAYFGVPNAGPSAHAHFVAAGIYGSVAGVAAIAGRQVAGGLFSQSGGASGSSGSSRGEAGPLQTIIQPRNQQQQIVRHEHVIRVESNDAHIVKVISDNWSDGGDIRELVLNDGKIN